MFKAIIIITAVTILMRLALWGTAMDVTAKFAEHESARYEAMLELVK